MPYCYYIVTDYSEFFFFFQAEDGIRDVAVTGVQTCALPICPEPPSVITAPVVRSWPPHPIRSPTTTARVRRMHMPPSEASVVPAASHLAFHRYGDDRATCCKLCDEARGHQFARPPHRRAARGDRVAHEPHRMARQRARHP